MPPEDGGKEEQKWDQTHGFGFLFLLGTCSIFQSSFQACPRDLREEFSLPIPQFSGILWMSLGRVCSINLLMWVWRGAALSLPQLLLISADDRRDLYQELLESPLTPTGSLRRATRKSFGLPSSQGGTEAAFKTLHSNRETTFHFLFLPLPTPFPHHSLRWVQGAGRLRGNRSRYAEVSYEAGMGLVTGAAWVSLADI